MQDKYLQPVYIDTDPPQEGWIAGLPTIQFGNRARLKLQNGLCVFAHAIDGVWFAGPWDIEPENIAYHQSWEES